MPASGFFWVDQPMVRMSTAKRGGAQVELQGGWNERGESLILNRRS